MRESRRQIDRERQTKTEPETEPEKEPETETQTDMNVSAFKKVISERFEPANPVQP